MNTEFRTKLRVKRWKLNEIQTAEILKRQQQPLNDYNQLHPQQIYPWPATSKCARCGMERPLNTTWGYACPEGNLCGTPRPSAPTVFIPQFQTVSQASLQSKADAWN